MCIRLQLPRERTVVTCIWEYSHLSIQTHLLRHLTSWLGLQSEAWQTFQDLGWLQMVFSQNSSVWAQGGGSKTALHFYCKSWWQVWIKWQATQWCFKVPASKLPLLQLCSVQVSTGLGASPAAWWNVECGIIWAGGTSMSNQFWELKDLCEGHPWLPTEFRIKFKLLPKASKTTWELASEDLPPLFPHHLTSSLWSLPTLEPWNSLPQDPQISPF